MSVPSVPLIFKRPDAIDQALLFFWEPPVSDGGSPVTSYFLTDGTLSYTIPESQRSYRVSALTNGTPYSFSLAASNANGLGPATPFRTVQPGFVPANITTLSTINLFNNTFETYWNSPASDASILGYVCKAHPVDSNYSTLIDSISTIIKPVNNPYIQKQKFSLGSNFNWRLSVTAVNDPGYSVTPAFSSTLLTSTDPKGSIYYDGTTKLVTNVDSELNLGSTTFTIEWWQSSAGGYPSFYSGTSPNYTLAVIINNTSITIYLNGTAYSISNVTAIDAWHHFALQRSGNIFTFFIDGYQVWTTTLSITLTLSGTIQIGSEVTGYITNFNYVKGSALYTSGFIPPRINFSTNTNTKMLLLSRTYEYTYLDSSLFNRAVTPKTIADATLSSITWSNYVPPAKPFGSIYFAQSSNASIEYVNTDSSLLPGSGDFSIEFFVNVSSIGTGFLGSPVLFSVGPVGTPPLFFQLGIGTASYITFGLTPFITLPIGLSFSNTWHHFIIERYQNYMYAGIGIPSLTPNGSVAKQSFNNYSFPSQPSSLFLYGGFNGAITNFKWVVGQAPYASTLGGATGQYVVPTRNLPTNQDYGQVLISCSDSNSPFKDYSKKNRTFTAISTIYSTINPFSNY